MKGCYLSLQITFGEKDTQLFHKRKSDMPTYTFRDTTTDEIFDVIMSMKDLDAYKVENPTHERYFDEAPKVVSGSSSSLKTDNGFKEVLSKIAEAHPNSELADNTLRKSIKQSRTERAVKKWKQKSASI